MAATSAAPTARTRTGPSGPTALRRLTVTEAKLYLRDPSGVFFALVFPALLLTVLGLVMPWADEPMDAEDPLLSQVTSITAYTPIVLALAIGTVAYSAFPVILATYREKGVLRRLSTTPVPPSRLLVAQILVSVAVLVVAALLAVLCGVLLLDIGLPVRVGVTVLAFLLGGASSIAVGCLIAARAPTAGSATGVGMLVYFVSLFFAGVWMPLPLLPEAVQTISSITPLGAASQALAAGWYEGVVPTTELLVMSAWTVVLVPLSAKLFRWS